jgi:hypothetical protein
VAQTPEALAARQAIEAQLLARDDRLLSAQRTTVDNAKLVTTFVLALASTLVGTALQVSPRGYWELVGLVLVGVSLLCALAVDGTPGIGPGCVRVGHWWVQASAYRAGAW